MDRETFWAFVFVGGIAWWAWRANHPKKLAPPAETIALSTPKGNGVDPFFSTIKDKEADPFFAQVQGERIAAEEQARRESKRYRDGIEAQVKDDEALKARLSKFAKDNKLDIALAQLWDAIRYYPAWSKRADFQQYNKLGVTGVGESESEDPDNKTVWFTYDGVKYTIKTRRWTGMEAEPYQDFSLYESDEEVFGIAAEVVYDDYATYYRPVNVKAFKRKGQWATLLVRLFAKLQLESEKGTADLRARMAADISEKFSD